MAKSECNEAIYCHFSHCLMRVMYHALWQQSPTSVTVATGIADANFYGASASSPQRHCVAWISELYGTKLGRDGRLFRTKGPKLSIISQSYPLVNLQKTMEHHHFFMGKCGQSTISMAHFQVRKLLLEGTPIPPHQRITS